MNNNSMFILGLPQFAGINFIFDNYFYENTTCKSLVLSELPALFKKYGIELNKNDIKTYINNIYNLTRECEFKKAINSLDDIKNLSYVKNMDQIKYLQLAKDLYLFYKKVSVDLSKNKDKLIDKLINERYGYYYNKYDENPYKKFMEFLNENIPQSGFFDVDVTTDEDLEKCKANWIDEKEQKIRNFFHTLKSVYPNTPIIFQSIRFYYVYLFLKNKYPEIVIEDAALDEIELPIRKRLKAIYVNDIYGDKQYKNTFNHYVVALPFDLKTILCQSKKFTDYFYKGDMKSKCSEIYNEHYYAKRKVTYGSAKKLQEIIEYLEYERRILEEDRVFITTSIDGLPEMFIPYFTFCLDNEKQISYFKLRMKEEKDKNKIIEEMINKFGKENVSDLLIDLLLEDKLITHELISNNEITPKRKYVKQLRK